MPVQPSIPALSVLIVDDDVRLVTALARSVRGLPRLRVHTANGVTAALETAARTALDVAIVDLVIGSESGVELIFNIRRDHPSVRIAAATGAASSGFIGEAVAAGAEVVMRKPYSLGMVAHALELPHAELRKMYRVSHASLELASWEHVHRVDTSRVQSTADSSAARFSRDTDQRRASGVVENDDSTKTNPASLTSAEPCAGACAKDGVRPRESLGDR